LIFIQKLLSPDKYKSERVTDGGRQLRMGRVQRRGKEKNKRKKLTWPKKGKEKTKGKRK